MDELIDKYIEQFGGIPWDFRSMTDDEIERHIKKALETGKPYKSDIEESDGDVLY